VLDGEIACLDESGRPTFRDLIKAANHFSLPRSNPALEDIYDKQTVPLQKLNR
jgi:hypothetical protein